MVFRKKFEKLKKIKKHHRITALTLNTRLSPFYKVETQIRRIFKRKLYYDSRDHLLTIRSPIFIDEKTTKDPVALSLRRGDTRIESVGTPTVNLQT